MRLQPVGDAVLMEDMLASRQRYKLLILYIIIETDRTCLRGVIFFVLKLRINGAILVFYLMLIYLIIVI